MQTPEFPSPAADVPPPEVLQALGIAADRFSKEDLQVIVRLPHKARAEMLAWHERLTPLLPSGYSRVKGIQKKLAEIAHTTGAPLVSVRRRYDAFRKQGWRGLVDRRLAGPLWWDRSAANTLSVAERPAFLDHWQSIIQRYQGRDHTGKSAYRALMRQLEAWQRGDETSRVPGYDVPPTCDPFTGHPTGWSLCNLLRPQHKLPPDEEAAAKYGRGALTDFRLPVLSTRQGLKVGEIVVFDDQEIDVRANFLGLAKESFRPLCFDAQDYLSAAQPLHGYKAVLADDATGKRRKLTELDFRWFVGAYLMMIGYRPDTGTTFIVEHGTAAISPEFERLIHLVTGGKVRIDRGGIAGQPAYPGMFEGQARGNFRVKATLESARVRLRNDMAALPGAVGQDREHAPEEDFGRERYNQRLLQAAVMLPRELVARLQFPLLDWWEFVAVTNEIHRLIDARTEHNLEGWERCRHIVHEYRISLDSNQWINAEQSFGLMDDQQRAAVCALVESTPGLWRSRQMSPQEVWDQGKGDLLTVPENALPMLMGPGAARSGERCERNKLFVVEDGTFDPEPMHFDASALVRQGCVQIGQRYSVFLNPFMPRRLVVCDAALRYLGTAHLWERIHRMDAGEAARAIAHAKRDEAPALRNLARRGAKQARRMIEMRENNAAALAGRPQPVTRRPLDPETTSDAILRAADDAALLDSQTPDPSTPLALPPWPPPRQTPRKTEKAEGDDLDLL